MLTVHVLGRVEVLRDGVPLDLGGPQQRAVVAHLAMDVGRVVSVERLIDRLWGDDPPVSPMAILQSYVSRLRRTFEPDRPPGTPPQFIVTEAPGYALRLPRQCVDVHRFAGLVNEARAAASDTAGPAAQLALDRLDEALGLWRGPPMAGIGPSEQILPIVTRLAEERELAIEDRFDALLSLGRHEQTIADLQTAVADQPLRERRWAQLALALYRSSRQADALRALAAARSVLVDELGLDPGPELRALESRVLAQDPSLLIGVATTRPAMVVTLRAERPTIELVGRRDEWHALVAALDRAEAGHPQLALVEGEPGIGKSTLGAALLAHATERGWHTAVGRCVESGLAPSLWPITEILRSLNAAGPDAAVEHTAVEVAEQVVALVDGLGGRPLLILLDDLHWADHLTLDVLSLVLERLGSRPVAWLAAHRPAELVPGSLLGGALARLARPLPLTRLVMPPLGTGEVARLMAITAGATPTDEVAERVRRRAGGNPLFVTELARLAGERGLDDGSTVPSAIRDVVRSRLALLPDGTTAELQIASLLGERFELGVVLAASEREPDACLDALDAAIVTRILVPDGDGWRFAHALVRDAVVGDITPLRRARLHQRVADAIQQHHGDGPDAAEPIAHHRLGSLAIADRIVVARSAVRASDVARWRGAVDDAEAWAEEALAVLTGATPAPDVDEVTIDALEALAGAALRRADVSATLAAAARIRSVADRLGGDATRALAMFLSSPEVDLVDDLTETFEQAEPARELAARTTSPYALVVTNYMAASARFLAGRLAEASEHLDAAGRAARLRETGGHRRRIPLPTVPVLAAFVAAARGQSDVALEHAHQTTAAWMAERSTVDHTTGIVLAFTRAVVHALLDDPVGTAQHAVPDRIGARGPVDPVDDPQFVAIESTTCRILAGWARVRAGDADGLPAAFAALGSYDEGVARVLGPCLRTFVADACLRLDDPRAVELLTRAHDSALSRGEVWWLPETLRLRAQADRRFGDGRQAAAWLDEAEQLAEAYGLASVLERLGADRR